MLRFINSRHGEKWWIWNLSVAPMVAPVCLTLQVSPL